MIQPSVSEYMLSPEKRALDLVVAGSAGMAMMGAGMLAAAGIVATDRVVPLFRQERIGLGGRLFSVIKLRTLNQDNEPLRLGKIMRESGLDETLEVVNVLLGQMSVVGYRPLLAEDLNYAASRLRTHFLKDSPHHPDRWLSLREQCKPGLTGPAQTMPLRADAGSLNHLVGVVGAECEYMENARLVDDLRFIARTPQAMLHGHNPAVMRVVS
jgi:putative colanic acid biosynthesis UDP-glucose lipid carrier transferase